MIVAQVCEVRVPLAPLFSLVRGTLPAEGASQGTDSSKVQQRWRRLVMLGGLPAAHRMPSMFASSVAGHLELTQVLAQRDVG